MPMEFLRSIALDELPLHVTDAEDVDKLRVLRAAGMVEADIDDTADHPATMALLTAVTGLGRATLRVQDAQEILARKRELRSTMGALL